MDVTVRSDREIGPNSCFAMQAVSDSAVYFMDVTRDAFSLSTSNAILRPPPDLRYFSM